MFYVWASIIICVCGCPGWTPWNFHIWMFLNRSIHSCLPVLVVVFLLDAHFRNRCQVGTKGLLSHPFLPTSFSPLPNLLLHGHCFQVLWCLLHKMIPATHATPSTPSFAFIPCHETTLPLKSCLTSIYISLFMIFQQLNKRHLRRSKSLISVLWGGAGGEDDDFGKAKNIRQTELLVDLREAILQVARHFQSLDPKNSKVVSVFFLTKIL